MRELTAEEGRRLLGVSAPAPRQPVQPPAWRGLEASVEALLNLNGWRWYHARPAQTRKGPRTALSGHPGAPDYMAVRDGRLLFIEAKDGSAVLTQAQHCWARDLAAVGGSVRYLIVRREDVESGRLADMLR